MERRILERRLLILTTLFLLYRFAACSLFGQTNISGTINTYTAVTAIDVPNNRMTVTSTAGFSVGDLLLIIQMQGATINTNTNSSAFGNILSYNGAGNYELALLCDIDNGDLVFENTLVNTYQVSGNLQIVRVPSYTDATVNATLTGQAWNGTTGGVLALAVTNTLRLDADIDMDGKGFRGGGYVNSTFGGCTFLSSYDLYAYNSFDFGGRKGEGIAAYSAGLEYGRGAQANGGGGGNEHNAGGGGGANGAAGGKGGENQDQGFLSCKGFFEGEGGKAPSLVNRLFMGGGGGAGHGNNNLGSSGTNGGGIILILANNLEVGASNAIHTDGIDALKGTSDGAGGGGSGGSIHLQVANYIGTPALSARGGDGGDTDNELLNNRCFGPGGGGSGGVVKANPALPGTIVPALNGGSAGLVTFSPCSGTLGALAGNTGASLTAAIAAGTVPDPSCGLLPVTWLNVDIKPVNEDYLIRWSTAGEQNNALFTVERSHDQLHFQPVGEVPSQGNGFLPVAYSWMEYRPLPGESFYRIRQTNYDGDISYSPVVRIKNTRSPRLAIYPNPIKAGSPAFLEIPLEKSQNVELEVIHITGKRVFSGSYPLTARVNQIAFPTHGITSGTYLVKVYLDDRIHQIKWIVR